MAHRTSRSLARRCACAGLAAALVLPAAVHAQAQRAQRPAGAASGPVDAQRARQQVTLNFVNAEIEAVTRAIGAMLDRAFVVDPRVKGQITLYSEQPLTVREAYLNYLAALRGLGFTVVETAGLLKVVPEADAKLQAGTVGVGSVPTRGDQVITQIFRLSHENPNNLVAVLRPLISPNNTINANPGNNTLVITDYADNLQRLGKIIAVLDQPASTDIEIVPLQHAVASDIATLVTRLADQTTGPVVPGAGVPGSGASSVLVDARSNSLIIRAASPVRLAQLRGMIHKLDRPASVGAGPAGNIWVIYLKNADASKLATVLRAAFSPGGGAGATSGSPVSTPSLSPTSTQGNVTSLGGSTAGGTAATAATAPLSASAAPSTGGFIQADPSTNSLVITGPEPLYRQIRAVVDQLDSRRSQVYVEALIVEVNVDKAAELGLQWLLFGSNSAGQVGALASTTFGAGTNNLFGLAASIAGGSSSDLSSLAASPPTGFTAGAATRFGGNDRYGLGLLARAFAGTTAANILSTPNLVTLDNEEAKIVVGQNVPFVTGSFTSTGTGTGATNPFQTIERKDVGLTLRIKPQIGEGNTVRMTIFQESSNVVTPAAGTANAGPSTSKRSIESTVVVDDGQIIVLGGLIEDTVNETRDKVPLLGDLPVVGGLFRSESRSRNKTNLMVFLRPVVMRTQDAATQISIDRYDLIRNLQITTQPAERAILGVNGAPVLPQLPSPNDPPSTVPSPGSNLMRPQPEPAGAATPASGAAAPASGAAPGSSSSSTSGEPPRPARN